MKKSADALRNATGVAISGRNPSCNSKDSCLDTALLQKLKFASRKMLRLPAVDGPKNPPASDCDLPKN